MLRGSIIERNELLLFLSGERVPRATSVSIEEVRTRMGPDRYAVLWESAKDSSSGKLPVIIVPDTGLREFYSFVSTYVNAYVPFSAFFRVIATSELDSVISDKLLPLYEPRLALTHNMVSIAMVEALIRRGDKQSKIDQLLVSDVKSTLTATLLHSASAFGATAPLREIGQKWDYLAKRISGDRSDISDVILEVVDSFLSSLNEAKLDRRSTHMGFVGSLVRDIAAEGRISEHHWRVFTERSPQISGAYQSLRGPREDRIKSLSNTLAVIQSSNHEDSAYAACLAGFTLALVADGSLQYLPLAVDISSDKRAVIWFAAWSSLLSKSDVLTVANAIGRRSARDIFVKADLYQGPTTDISFEEFRLQGSSFTKNGHTSMAGTISIELYPTIPACFRIPMPSDDSQPLDVESSRRFIEETQHYLDRARVSLNRMLDSKSRYKGKNRGQI